MLHIVSGTQPSLIDGLLQVIVDKDTLVFTDEGFYHEQRARIISQLSTFDSTPNTLLVTNKQLGKDTAPNSVVSFTDFIHLCETHAPIKTWY